MSWTDELLTGVAAYLALEVDDEAVGTWRTSGAYQPGDVRPIFLNTSPAGPDVCITLAAYPVASATGLNDVTEGLQVRCRGARDASVTAQDVADAVFDRLHDAEGLDLGNGIRAVLIQHNSGAALGEDSDGRPERTDNYYVLSNRPSLHRPD